MSNLMILELLARVAASLPAVPKGQSAPGLNYSFRGIDDIINITHKPLTDAGIVIVPEVLEVVRCETFTNAKGNVGVHLIAKYKHIFFAPDGSNVHSVTLGEAIDYSDKAANKAHSTSLKYAIGEVLYLAFSMEEQDADRPEMGARAPQAPTGSAPDESPFPPGGQPAPNYDRPAAPQRPVPSAGQTPPSLCISQKQAGLLMGILRTGLDRGSPPAQAAEQGLVELLHTWNIAGTDAYEMAQHIPKGRWMEILQCLPTINELCYDAAMNAIQNAKDWAARGGRGRR